jgi:ABC-type transporter Mla MlaB component
VNLPSNQLTREGEILYLQGQINFQTVTVLYRMFTQEMVSGVSTLDCSKVEQCDSSAISLLLACRRLALGRQIRLQIRGMNEQMLSLARLYEVEAVLQAADI